MSLGYPFTALVGQETMKLALVLNAVNPRLGGVLIRGQKGTAKSTAARGLGALLPPVEVVEGCRFGCDPSAATSRCAECDAHGAGVRSTVRPAAFVELPIGATEDRVLGTLDLERALVDGQRHFEPGLLARANRGLLYVDEVNLLPDHLVDTLLDAAAMGTNRVERDGVSFSHPAAFVLVGTMNPEEGELRPQLLDRFALAVDVEGMPTTSERAEVVRRRVAFDADPVGFCARWEAAECATQARIRSARLRLPDVQVEDRLLELIAEICTTFEVDGLRADIVIYKTAATLAAYARRSGVTVEDVRRAAELALPHRRRRQPFDQPGLDHAQLDEIVRQYATDSNEKEPPDAADGPRDGDEEGPPPTPPPDGQAGGATAPPDPQGSDVYPAERVFDAADLAAPPPAPPPMAGARRHRGQTPRAARRSRTLVEGPRGRQIRSTPRRTPALDLPATLLVAAPLQIARGNARPAAARAEVRPGGEWRLRVRRADLRYTVRAAPVGTLTVFAVDASGSMAAQRRMALAKGAVLALLQRAYQTRAEVALIAFRGTTAEVLLPPTGSVHLASVRLRALPTGGRTPLALALGRAASLFAQRAATGRANAMPMLVLVSDGRANVPLSTGGNPNADALDQAQVLRAAGVAAVVIDTEEGPVRLGRARPLAAALGAEYVPISALPAGPINLRRGQLPAG